MMILILTMKINVEFVYKNKIKIIYLHEKYVIVLKKIQFILNVYRNGYLKKIKIKMMSQFK